MDGNTFLNTVVLTAAVFAALISSIANIIISLVNNHRLKKIEKQKQMNEIDKYRYSRLDELLLNWHNYDSVTKGETASEIAFYKLQNSYNIFTEHFASFVRIRADYDCPCVHSDNLHLSKLGMDN